MRVPAAIRDAMTPVVRVISSRHPFAPPGTLVEAGPHPSANAPGWVMAQITIPCLTVPYTVQMGFAPDEVQPVNAAALSLFHRAPVPGPVPPRPPRGRRASTNPSRG